MKLRPAVGDDAEKVVHVYVDSWNKGFGHRLGVRGITPGLVERWRTDLTAGTVRWTVAEVSAVVVGFVGVGPSRDPIDPDLGELDAIAVDPSHWRTGVGRRLMHHALDVLADSWAKAVLWTPADYERGHRFYEATGWTALGWSRRDGTEVAFGRDL
ncbi:MAG TPA: GNAT family N-acetyltransferase [Acidimicrobiales bacterium]|nr:GNAT family N-acetyltransferase [Acidimicrobiales bacterium]